MDKKIEKTINKHIEKIVKIYEKEKKYYEQHKLSNQKAKLLKCKQCGSQINKEYLKCDNTSMVMSERKEEYLCPCCDADLRSEYIVNKIKEYNIEMAEEYAQMYILINSLEEKDKKEMMNKYIHNSNQKYYNWFYVHGEDFVPIRDTGVSIATNFYVFVTTYFVDRQKIDKKYSLKR